MDTGLCVHSFAANDAKDMLFTDGWTDGLMDTRTDTDRRIVSDMPFDFAETKTPNV